MGRYSIGVLFCSALLGLGIGLMSSCGEKAGLVFLSGAGMKAPVTEIAENFERETGVSVQTYFKGSMILNDYITKFHTGDIFLPGDKKSLDILKEKGLVADSCFMAWHVVAILISPDQKERIRGLDDLANPGVRVAFSNPRLASLGNLVMENIIKKHPNGEDILKNVVVYGSSSLDVLRLYKQGGIDAIFEWDVMASVPEGKGLIVVPISEPYQVRDELHVGLLKDVRNPALAREFFDYVKTNGKLVFSKYGYDINP
ncbi:MAG: substrate-binding domain-containing protein [Desulfobulbaceae bacterium]|nr:substrate-binding domain-containing protein [Desulfobulbaceae bacterium]